MARYDAKTTPTAMSVDAYLNEIADERKRSDALRLREIMEEVSGEPAVMWGPSIVGCGTYHYRYASGHEGDAAAIGFAARSANLTIYIVGGFEGHEDILDRLGKHKISKACLHIKRLSDIDESALRELIQISRENAARLDAESREG